MLITDFGGWGTGVWMTTPLVHIYIHPHSYLVVLLELADGTLCNQLWLHLEVLASLGVVVRLQ